MRPSATRQTAEGAGSRDLPRFVYLERNDDRAELPVERTGARAARPGRSPERYAEKGQVRARDSHSRDS